MRDLNPRLSAEELAQLAEERPDLRPAILTHPNLYPELADWIYSQQGINAENKAGLPGQPVVADSLPGVVPVRKAHRGWILAFILAVVLIPLVLVGLGILAWLAWSNDSTTTGAIETNSPTDNEIAESLGIYADGRPIVVGQEGVGKPTSGTPEVTEYFSYSCHVCADLDLVLETDLTQAIKQGKLTVNFQMVAVADPVWRDAATAGALQIAQHDPEKFLPYHHAVMTYFQERDVPGKGRVFDNADLALEQVKAIALQVGVSSTVIDKFDVPAAEAYLEISTSNWWDTEIEGRTHVMGTPEFVREGKILTPHITDAAGKSSRKPADEFIKELTD